VILESLALSDFRGYSSLELDLDGRLSVLVGRNAQGKTNLLRSIELLGLGDAHGSWDDMIRFGGTEAIVEGSVKSSAGSEQMIALISPSGAKLSLNGKRATRPSWVGRLPVLFIGPDDRNQVVGPPSVRREMLDEMLEQSEPAYLAALREFRRALKQRNRALEFPGSGREEVEVWDDPVTEHGGLLISHRLRILENVAPRAAAWYRELSGSEVELRVSYKSGSGLPAGNSARECADCLRAALAATREREMAQGTTVVGPHRDDVEIVLGASAMRSVGSAGEVWTAILSLALSFAERMGEKMGRLPLLLLDDVLSSLDSDRKGRLLGVLEEMTQAVLTTTQVPQPCRAQAVYEVVEHKVRKIGGRENPGKEAVGGRRAARH